MVKFTSIKSNYLLLVVLVVAFLSMQWTTSHVHLATQHHHDGNHHQHALTTHAHHSASPLFSVQPSNQHKQHADVIDVAYPTAHNFSHQMHQSKTVELNTDYSLPKKGKQKPLFDALTSPKHTDTPYVQQTNPLIHSPVLAKINYLDHSTVNPRAPPQI